jgi:hypothetical protein
VGGVGRRGAGLAAAAATSAGVHHQATPIAQTRCRRQKRRVVRTRAGAEAVDAVAAAATSLEQLGGVSGVVGGAAMDAAVGGIDPRWGCVQVVTSRDL